MTPKLKKDILSYLINASDFELAELLEIVTNEFKSRVSEPKDLSSKITITEEQFCGKTISRVIDHAISRELSQKQSESTAKESEPFFITG